MTLVHRINTTFADNISNISAIRWGNLTEQWGGYNNTTTGPPDFGKVIYYTVQMYPDALGQIALFILFFLPFVMMWVAHGDMVPAAVVAFFFGVYIAGYVAGGFFTVGLFMAMFGAITVFLSLYMRR